MEELTKERSSIKKKNKDDNAKDDKKEQTMKMRNNNYEEREMYDSNWKELEKKINVKGKSE